MKYINPLEYKEIEDKTLSNLGKEIILEDHLNGFDKSLKNNVLDSLFNHYEVETVYWHNVIDERLKQEYPNLKFSMDLQCRLNFDKFAPTNDEFVAPSFEHFICSFNGAMHVGRRLLLSALNSYGYYDTKSVSKIYAYSKDNLIGHVCDYADKKYLNYFIREGDTFEQSINNINYARFDHSYNIFQLSDIILNSFVHVVSETMSETYYPLVTEKFLYSVLKHGLFVAYAQPGYHKHIRDYYGFKLYDTIFDYSFDSQVNPVFRLLEMLGMLSKFQNLNFENRRDLYLIEQDKINFNFHHYKSGDYKKHLAQYDGL